MRMATFAASLALCSAPVFAVSAAAKTDGPGPIDGHVVITAQAADVGVGFTWGSGILKYHGHTYHFSVKGVDVAAVGYSKVVGHGRVYNLHHLHDFDGTYAAANGEATVGQGIGGRYLKNGAGVGIRIDDVTHGARLSGAAQGIQLELSK
ncbi:hypothetical protein [Lichenicoccus sp.]|uniref:hypothetical protein n=1 Tax=Lichenicoccus sp. TaxID=2781899 RepID=UPI003D150080